MKHPNELPCVLLLLEEERPKIATKIKRDDYFPLEGCYRNSVAEDNETKKLSKVSVLTHAKVFK